MQATGKPEEPEIKSISSSELSVLVELAPKIAASIASGAKKVVEAYKTLRDLRQIINDLLSKKIPEEDVQPLKKRANSMMEKSVEEISVEVVQEYCTIKDEHRKNEIRNGIRISLTMIANRIDAGFNLEVRINPPAAADAKKETPEYVETIRDASSSLQFMRLEGAPILSLPEPEKSRTEGDGKPGRRGRKIK